MKQLRMSGLQFEHLNFIGNWAVNNKWTIGGLFVDTTGDSYVGRIKVHVMHNDTLICEVFEMTYDGHTRSEIRQIS